MKNHKHTVQAGFNPWSPFASPIHNALNHNCFLQMWFPSLFLLSNVEMMVLKKINHHALGTAPTQRYQIDFIRTTIRRFRYISIANISWCYRPTDMSFRLCLTCSHALWALVCLALHMALCSNLCRRPPRGLTQTMIVYSWLQPTCTWKCHARHGCMYSMFSLHLPTYTRWLQSLSESVPLCKW